MRVAFVTPLPPAPSGIADYSAQLLPVLAETGLEIAVYFDGPPPERDFPFPCLPVARLGERPQDPAVRLYQIGNDARFHAGIYRAAMRHPGVVVLHETMIHHLVRQLALDHGGPAAYLRALTAAYGDTGRGVGEVFTTLGVTEGLWRFPLFEPLVDRSLGVIVHSQTAARRVWASRPEAAVTVVPMLATPPSQEEVRATAAAARRHHGLAERAFVVGCFGYLTAPKRLPALLRSFHAVRRGLANAGRESYLLLVGAASPDYDMASLLSGEAGRNVVHTGRVPEAELLAAMAAVDVAVNLRHPTGGETSATLMRLLERARPVVVTNDGSFAEVPDGCCAKVDPDDEEEAVLTAYLQHFAKDPALGRQVGENGRRFLEATAAPARVRDGYRQALERALTAPIPQAETVPVERGDIRRRLLRTLGADLADLGIPAGDAALPEVARIVAEVVPVTAGDRAP